MTTHYQFSTKGIFAYSPLHHDFLCQIQHPTAHFSPNNQDKTKPEPSIASLYLKPHPWFLFMLLNFHVQILNLWYHASFQSHSRTIFDGIIFTVVIYISYHSTDLLSNHESMTMFTEHLSDILQCIKKHSKISWRFWCYEIMVFRKLKSQSKQTSPPYIFIVMLNSLISPQTSTVGSYHWLVCCSTCRHPLKSNNYVLTVVRSLSLTKHPTTDLSMCQLSHSGQSGIWLSLTFEYFLLKSAMLKNIPLWKNLNTFVHFPIQACIPLSTESHRSQSISMDFPKERLASAIKNKERSRCEKIMKQIADHFRTSSGMWINGH